MRNSEVVPGLTWRLHVIKNRPRFFFYYPILPSIRNWFLSLSLQSHGHKLPEPQISPPHSTFSKTGREEWGQMDFLLMWLCLQSERSILSRNSPKVPLAHPKQSLYRICKGERDGYMAECGQRRTNALGSNSHLYKVRGFNKKTQGKDGR